MFVLIRMGNLITILVVGSVLIAVIERIKMNEDLRLKYPELLEHCWDLSTGPGWHSLVDNLLAAIKEEINKTPGLEVSVVQVKSKFRGLRFYYDGGNEAIHHMADLAEEKSYSICEECGEEAADPDQFCRLNRGWYSTLCDKCKEGT